MSETHMRILSALRASLAGMTDEDLELVLGIEPNTLRPRRRELMMQGKVKDSGLTRMSRSGKPCVVWCACEEEPQPPVRRGARLALATKPVIAECRALVETYPDAADGAVFTVRLPMRAVRELAALEDHHG